MEEHITEVLVYITDAIENIKIGLKSPILVFEAWKGFENI